MRIGTGWDIHRLTEGRKLVLGGVTVPHTKGEEGHSDGDVLIHAIIDALLGAAVLGDIGTLFPPSDPAYKEIDSAVLLDKTVKLIERKGYSVVNLDTTVILQEPKLKDYIPAIRRNLASLINISIDSVSIKAKTKEKLGSVGRGEAVEASASLLLEETDDTVWL